MEQGEFTQLLEQYAEGGVKFDRIAPLVYQELHRMALAHFQQERPDHTLQPTALINEAYLKLVQQDRRQWKNRTHFFATASRVMREILVSHARKVRAGKRGSGAKVQLDESINFALENSGLLAELDDALRELAEFDERKSRIIEMKYFGGLGAEEIAEALHISTATITRDSRLAEAWLERYLAVR